MAATGLAASSPWIVAQTDRGLSSEASAVPNSRPSSDQVANPANTNTAPEALRLPASADGAANPSVPSTIEKVMFSSRSARTLFRNGLDYIKYQQFEKALTYLREAERRQNELNAAEKSSLKQAIAAAQEGLRTPSLQSGYARSRRPQSGSIAIAGRTQAPRSSESPIRTDAPKDLATIPASAESPIVEPASSPRGAMTPAAEDKLAPLSPEILAKNLPSASDLAQSESSKTALREYQAAGHSSIRAQEPVSLPRPLNENLDGLPQDQSEFQASESGPEPSPEKIARALTNTRLAGMPSPLPGSPTKVDRSDAIEPLTVAEARTEAAPAPVVETPALPPLEEPEPLPLSDLPEERAQLTQMEVKDLPPALDAPLPVEPDVSESAVDTIKIEPVQVSASLPEPIDAAMPKARPENPPAEELTAPPAEPTTTPKPETPNPIAERPESTPVADLPKLPQMAERPESTPVADLPKLPQMAADKSPEGNVDPNFAKAQDLSAPRVLTPLEEDSDDTKPSEARKLADTPSPALSEPAAATNVPALDRNPSVPMTPSFETAPPSASVEADVPKASIDALPPLPASPTTSAPSESEGLPPLPTGDAAPMPTAAEGLPPLPTGDAAPMPTAAEGLPPLPGTLAETSSGAEPGEASSDFSPPVSDTPPAPTATADEPLPELPATRERVAQGETARPTVVDPQIPPAPPAEEVSNLTKSESPTPAYEPGSFSRRFMKGLSDEQRREIEALARVQQERTGGTTPGLSPLDSPAREAGDIPRVPMPAGANPMFGATEDPLVRLELPRAPSPAEARPIRAILLPEQFDTLKPRQFDPRRKMWASAATAHYPLYFQDPTLERYGISVEQRLGTAGRKLTYPIDDPNQSKLRNQIATPFFSSGLFALQIATWPFRAIADPPWESTYDLGYYRPGDIVPEDTVVIPWKGVGPLFRGNGY
jgi:hypothetical protein